MDDPASELEEEAQFLRQRAWVLGQFYRALRDNGVPDVLADALTGEWWSSQLDEESVLWRDDGSE